MRAGSSQGNQANGQTNTSLTRWSMLLKDKDRQLLGPSERSNSGARNGIPSGVSLSQQYPLRQSSRARDDAN